ncbi:MAG: FtsQ-type POTRA domain-containing protein [Candidatus Omnitrophica bacterium]|nr:FtsQ-type POTRA domain-containing protein [Candidatus Omnitrophota bacterium]
MARKSKIDIPAVVIRNGILCFIILLFVMWVWKSASNFLHTAPIFRIEKVTADADVKFLEARLSGKLRGKNIFSVDLKRLHREIRAIFPQVYDLSVERRFPDSIHINAKRRDPLAQVLADDASYLVIDDEGVIIAFAQKPVEKYPSIIHAHIGKQKIALGTRLATQEIKSAITVIKAYENNNTLSKYPLSDIDVDNLTKIGFKIGPFLEIILDNEDISSKLDMLVSLIQQKRLDFREIKYIDLRFKEPVVGKK